MRGLKKTLIPLTKVVQASVKRRTLLSSKRVAEPYVYSLTEVLVVQRWGIFESMVLSSISLNNSWPAEVAFVAQASLRVNLDQVCASPQGCSLSGLFK